MSRVWFFRGIPLTLTLFVSLTLVTNAKFGESPFSLSLESDQLISDEASIFSARLNLSAPLSRKDGSIIAVTASYERLFLDWNAVEFESLNDARLSLFTLNDFSDKWSVFTLTSVQHRGSDEISFGDALTFSGIYSAWYKGWENLSLGGGFIISTRLNDSLLVVPIILLDWEFSRHWSLTTRPTPGTRFGPGLSITYDPDSNIALFFGARYLSSRYQLENDELFEKSSTRLFATIQYALNENLALSATGGINLGGEIEVGDESIDRETTPFFGLDLSWRF